MELFKILLDILFIIFALYCFFNFKDYTYKLLILIFLYPIVLITLIYYGLNPERIFVYYNNIYKEYFQDAKYMAYLGFTFFILTIWSKKDKFIYLSKIHLSPSLRIILFAFLFLTAFVSYPSAFRISNNGQRFNLLPGFNWQVLYLAFNVFFLLSIKKKFTFLNICYLLLILILNIGGERVESILCFFVFFFVINSENDKSAIHTINTNKYNNFIQKYKFYLLLIFIFILGAIGEYLRRKTSGNLIGFFTELIEKLFAQETAVDVVHIYFSAFKYIDNKGNSFYPIINELVSFIPTFKYGGPDSSYNFTVILDKYIINFGGGLFYTEGLLIFGYVGVIIYSVLYGFILNFLTWKKNLYFSSILLLFIILSLRLQWYGLIYFHTTMVLLLIFSFLFKLLPKKK